MEEQDKELCERVLQMLMEDDGQCPFIFCDNISQDCNKCRAELYNKGKDDD